MGQRLASKKYAGRTASRASSIAPIWDIAILSADSIGYVHDECLLEVADFQGTVRQSFLGRGHGSQLFRTPKPLLYIVEPDDEGKYPWNNRGMMLLQLDDDQLHELVRAPGTYTFSVDRNCVVLGRRDRSFQTQREDATVDLILNLRSREVTWHDFGHYDVFNHYLRVDGAPTLSFCKELQKAHIETGISLPAPLTAESIGCGHYWKIETTRE
jgi:hypothetical protein